MQKLDNFWLFQNYNKYLFKLQPINENKEESNLNANAYVLLKWLSCCENSFGSTDLKENNNLKVSLLIKIFDNYLFEAT